MMSESKTRVLRVRSLQLALAATLTLAGLGTPRTARASTSYPPEVQKALDAQFGGSHCVPQCTICHLTNTGGIGTLNVFGKNLKQYGPLSLGNPGAVVGAFDNYFKATPPAGVPVADTVFSNGTPNRPFFDSDNDKISDYTELEQGDSPSAALPGGVDELCPADVAVYGCFARVAAAPPPADRLGLLCAGLTVLGLTVFRRLKRVGRPS